MRHILRRRDWVADPWRYLGEAEAGTAEFPDIIVAVAELRRDLQRWHVHAGRLGVRLSMTDPPEDLADLLPQLALVAIEFPNPTDGRGYSQGRLLRTRLGFQGELRAVGNGVRLDQIFLMARCGFDALELAAGVNPDAARHSLDRYSVAYQPGDPALHLQRERFSALR